MMLWIDISCTCSYKEDYFGLNLIQEVNSKYYEAIPISFCSKHFEKVRINCQASPVLSSPNGGGVNLFAV